MVFGRFQSQSAWVHTYNALHIVQDGDIYVTGYGTSLTADRGTIPPLSADRGTVPLSIPHTDISCQRWSHFHFLLAGCKSGWGYMVWPFADV